MFKRVKNIHIIGIGGAGLSGIAEILLGLGFKVSGSDLVATDVTHRLSKLGAKIFYGHSPQNISSADVIVRSPSIPPENSEIIYAQQRKIPIIRGAEMLAELMRMKFSVAISGTHGKTTTTAMVATVLKSLDPSVVVGGKLIEFGTNAKIGNSDLMVIEADEAYGSVKEFFPSIAVVTSIDADHLDYYGNIHEIGETLLNFVNRVPFYGLAVICSDEPEIQKIESRIKRRYITYAIKNEAELMAEKIENDGPTTRYKVRKHGEILGDVHLKMPGKHNILNSLAAIAVALELELSFDEIRSALENFRGIHRRFELVGVANDVILIDDYAHNPAKIRAAIEAARDAYGHRRIIVIFQPHRYGRTMRLADQLALSFGGADLLVVTAIYGAEEKPIEGVTAEKLAQKIREQGHKNVLHIDDKNEVAERLLGLINRNDLVITIGAGDIWKVGHQLLRKLQNQ